ncbi:MAG: hypothetical protein ABIN91_06780 [Mucilaginibacter sp.]|uniref:hypothetical protein n=1 Tax=Mucilaginibacter sp. TaxID=1882438 RepID=UPI0032662D83
MDDTKKALLSIELDTAALTQNAEKAKETVKALAGQLKELKAAGKESGDAFDKIVEQLKKASEEASKSNEKLKEFGKGLVDAAKAAGDLSAQQQKATQDTNSGAAALDVLKQRYAASTTEVAALGQQFSLLNHQSITLKETHGKNSEEVKTLQNQLLGLNAQIKNAKANSAEYKNEIAQLTTQQAGNSTAIANTSRSVGDYTNAVVHAIEAHTPFGKSVGEAAQQFATFKEGATKVITSLSDYKAEVAAALAKSETFNSNTSIFAKGFEVLKTGTSVATGGFEGLGKAISGTGFGLLLTVLAAVIDKFKTFTPLVEFCDKITAALNGTFDALGNMVIKLVAPMGKIFTEPKQALVDFGHLLIENVVNRFKAISVIGEGVWHILKGIFTLDGKEATKGFKGLTDGVIQLNTGVTNATDKIAGFAKTIGNASQQAFKLKGAQQDLDRQVQTSAIKSHEEAAKMADLSRKMATADLATRKKLQAEIDAIQKGATQRHKTEVDRQISITTSKVAAAHGLSQKELSQLTADDVEKLRVSKNLNAEEVKSLQEAVKQRADLGKEEAEAYAKGHQTKQEELKVHLEKMQTIHDKAKKQKKKDPQQAAPIETQKSTSTDDNNSLSQGKDAFDKTTAAVAAQEAKTNDNALKNKKKTVLEELKILKDKTAAYQQHFTKLALMFGKNTQMNKAAFLAQKAFAAAEVAISTEKSVAASILATKNAIAEDSRNPFPLNVALVAKDIAFGVIDVATTIADGAKQISTINSSNPSGFARGGLYLSDGNGAYLTGPGSGTSDSINAKLSNGESIINARSTQMFAPVLSAINQAGGGKAFNTAGNGNNYALGGIFSGSDVLNDSSNELAQTRALNDMARIMAANMPRQILVVEDVQAGLQNKAMLQSMSNF